MCQVRTPEKSMTPGSPQHHCPIDKMSGNPELRSEFLTAATQATGCTDEQQLLWSLVALRKKKALPSVLK